MDEELLEIVDETGAIIGVAPRAVIHADASLLHRVVHLLVVNAAGELLLQKRSAAKEVAPGKWDTSVGGHVARGESVEEALGREMREELGFSSPVRFLYSWIYRSSREAEMVFSYLCRGEGPFAFDREEIETVRFWPPEEIDLRLGEGIFSRQFLAEYARYLEYLRGEP